MARVVYLTPNGWVLDTGCGRPANWVERWEEALEERDPGSGRWEDCWQSEPNEEIPAAEHGKVKARYPSPPGPHTGGPLVQ